MHYRSKLSRKKKYHRKTNKSFKGGALIYNLITKLLRKIINYKLSKSHSKKLKPSRTLKKS